MEKSASKTSLGFQGIGGNFDSFYQSPPVSPTKDNAKRGNKDVYEGKSR
jgi:hypothetical protein